MISNEHNVKLTSIPNMDELQTVVFSKNPISAAGPDGMNVYFFQ